MKRWPPSLRTLARARSPFLVRAPEPGKIPAPETIVSMAGAGVLSSSPQPLTARPGRPLTLNGALRASPRRRGASATAAPTRGEGFPLKGFQIAAP